MLALVPQVIWNFGTEGLMNEFGGTGNRDGGNHFGRIGHGGNFIIYVLFSLVLV